MELYLYRSGFCLLPAFPLDADALTRMKENEVHKLTITKPRNYQFHKKYFALLNVGFEAQDTFSSFEWWREWVTIKAGWFEHCTTPDGETMTRARSISFANMDDFEFSELFKAVSQVIIDVCHISEQQIEENLSLFI